jgi:hypothetical protein
LEFSGDLPCDKKERVCTGRDQTHVLRSADPVPIPIDHDYQHKILNYKPSSGKLQFKEWKSPLPEYFVPRPCWYFTFLYAGRAGMDKYIAFVTVNSLIIDIKLWM